VFLLIFCVSLPFIDKMLSLLLSALLSTPASAVNNGLARTPQMGWNNWNSLGCDVSESLLLDTSKILLDAGLRDVGYEYVVLDDCWQDERGSDGYIKPDLKKFPHGMKWVAEQLHEMGFLYGMYSSAGEMTCARYEGSLDHEVEDATSFASWDVDYLKYDNCFHMGRFGYPKISFDRYNTMWKALNATGRPILYSLCSWGEDYVHTWGMSIANSWRVSGDIYDHFNRPDALCACDDPKDPHCVAPGTHCSVMNIINRVSAYVDRGAYGGWNDLDMLEVGLGGMTDEEYKVCPLSSF
jgi:alpha-galactosidase